MNCRAALFRGVFIAAIGLWLAVDASAQLQFTAISNTPEGSIQLTWASISNETYEIDEADTLETNAQGTITWNQLYTQYPSQGTNTFWLDTGNYYDVPPILNPKYTTNRFYRVVDLGPDSMSDKPRLTVTGPTNGSVVAGSLTIMVSASTDQPELSTLLYVDGQVMPTFLASTNYVENGTNYLTNTYVINTCEWFNGSHTLFATAMTASTLEGPANGSPNYTAHGVSPFVQVTFNNLVQEIAFSQAFFDPTLGQTQLVTAVFASNSDWTLTIINAASNTVRTATGSGTSMAFNWDGTGTGETSLPAGVYYYLISAYTNGQGSGGGGTNGGNGNGEPPPPSGDDVSPRSSLNGATEIGFEVIPLPPAPVPFFYGRDAEGNEITTMEVPAPSSTSEESALLARGVHPDGAPSPASSQSAPAAPVRPPTAPVDGRLGTFGVAYQTYSGNGGAPYSLDAPNDGCISGFNEPLQINGLGGNSPNKYDPLPYAADMAKNFADAMHGYGWWQGFSTLADDNLTAQSLRGIANPFNYVELGLLILHGAYGSSKDCNGGVNCKQMYFPITSGSGAQYVSMSDMDFGEVVGTNGLKWMAIFACHSLDHNNWQSMQDQRVYPYNANLHLLLGSDTDCYDALGRTTYWVVYMQHGTQNGVYSPLTIQQAWYQSAAYCYRNSGQTYPSTITFAVAGDSACLNDTLQTNSTPTGTWQYFTQDVWTP